MGNCWSQSQCFGVESTARKSRNASGSNPNPISHSDGSVVHDIGSDPSHVRHSVDSAVRDNGSIAAIDGGGSATDDEGSEPSTDQLRPPSSLQASNSDLSLEVAFTVQEIEDLEKLLDYVQEVINKHKAPGKFDSRVILSKVDSDNLNQGNHLLDQISKAVDQKKTIGGIAAEAQTILPLVLQGLANLHWAAAGISMLAFVSDRLDQMHVNKEECLSIIEILGDFSCSVVALLRGSLPNAHEKLCKAIFLISEGVIWCDKQLQSSRFKRFTFVNTTRDYIEDFKSRVNQLYRDLNLAVGTQTLKETRSLRRQTTRPLDPYKFPYPTNGVGLEPKVSEVLRLLGVTRESIEPGVRAILLHGIGGIGKTTLAKATCAKIPITGRFVAQVEVGEHPTSERVCNLQMEILERLSGTKQRIGNYEEGQQKLQNHLSQLQAPVLLFIDNVFSQKDLKQLLPPGLVLPDRSRLVITSRDSTVSDVLDEDTIKHPVQELNIVDSRKLFDYHLGVCPPGKDDNINTILQICGGLPLAVEIVGSHLKAADRKKKPKAWNSAIDSLEQFQNVAGRGEDKLNPVLRWSYNQLEHSSKQFFLDVCCLLRNADWDWDWVECLSSGSELECLTDLSLVKKAEKKVENGLEIITSIYVEIFLREPGSTVEVHDLLAALGNHISESPRTRFSFSSREELQNFLKNDQQDHSAMEGLVVDYPRYNSKLTLPAGMLDAAHQSLRILVLHRVQIRDKCSRIPDQLRICSTRSFPGVPVIDEVVFPYTDISRFNKLVVLEIQGGTAFDFADVQLPPNLEILRLADVLQLRTFHSDAFKKCSCLRILLIIHCPNLRELPPSCCSLTELRTLILDHNFELETLPDLNGLSNLEFLTMNGVFRMKMLPDGFGVLGALQTLQLSCCLNLVTLPDSIGSLKNLRKLDVSSCIRLERLPGGFSDLVALQVLDLSYCDKLKAMPDMGLFIDLRRLDLSGCTRLEKLPDDFSNLTALESIFLSSCTSLEKLPGSFGDLAALRELHLPCCENLVALPNSISSLKNLRQLDLTFCTRMENLPDDYGNLTTLEELRLAYCTWLEKLPGDLGNLIALQVLDLTGCENLVALPNSISSLKNLRQLNLKFCARLENLPNDVGNLTTLEILELAECTRLEKLPGDLGNLIALQVLDLTGCDNVVALPDSILHLKSLQLLKLEGCENLVALPDSILHLKSLQVLNLKRCSRLERLPTNIRDVLPFTDIYTEGCTGLGNFSDGFSVADLEESCNSEEIADAQSETEDESLSSPISPFAT